MIKSYTEETKKVDTNHSQYEKDKLFELYKEFEKGLILSLEKYLLCTAMFKNDQKINVEIEQVIELLLLYAKLINIERIKGKK